MNFWSDKANSFRMRAAKLSLFREQEYSVNLIKWKMITQTLCWMVKTGNDTNPIFSPNPVLSAGLRVKAAWGPLPGPGKHSPDYWGQVTDLGAAQGDLRVLHKPQTSSKAKYANRKWTWATAKLPRLSSYLTPGNAELCQKHCSCVRNTLWLSYQVPGNVPGFPKNRFWCLCHGHPMGDRAHFPLGCTQVKYLLPFVHSLCFVRVSIRVLGPQWNGILRYSPDTPTFTHFISGFLPLRKVLKNAAIGTAEIHESGLQASSKILQPGNGANLQLL